MDLSLPHPLDFFFEHGSPQLNAPTTQAPVVGPLWAPITPPSHPFCPQPRAPVHRASVSLEVGVGNRGSQFLPLGLAEREEAEGNQPRPQWRLLPGTGPSTPSSGFPRADLSPQLAWARPTLEGVTLHTSPAVTEWGPKEDRFLVRMERRVLVGGGLHPGGEGKGPRAQVLRPPGSGGTWAARTGPARPGHAWVSWDGAGGQLTTVKFSGPQGRPR